MDRKGLWAILIVGLLYSNTSFAAGKPDVTRHEASFLESAVNLHVEWQSPNPVVMVKISLGNIQKEIKVDPYDNRRNPSGYSGEADVTIALDWIPSQPFSYVIQLEDELRIKSPLVTGKVKVPQVRQPVGVMQPQPPAMQIQIQQNIPPPPPQPGTQPGTQAGPQPKIPSRQQTGIIIVLIGPENMADAGAMWRVGNGPWMRNGEALADLPIGIHTIEFQEVGGWIKPENQNIAIEDDKTITITGVYKKR